MPLPQQKDGLPLNETGFVRASTLPRTKVWWETHPPLIREEANLSEKGPSQDVPKEDSERVLNEKER